MKEKITVFINNLILYDYILFGGIFFLFILFLILTILLRQKFFLAMVMLFTSFVILFAGPYFGYIEMHKFLFKNSTTLISQKKLHFTQAVIVKGTLTNESKFDFKSCTITASAYKVSGNPVKDFLFPFNPFKKMSIIEEDIQRGEIREFKIIVEPFIYTKDYNISLGASCK